MISCMEDALEFFKKTVNTEKLIYNKDELQASIKFLQNVSVTEGLLETDIDAIVNFITQTKINAQSCISLFDCLIPKTTVSKHSLEEILIWFFTELANEKMSNVLAKKCLNWLTGLAHYELVDVSVIESFYYSFLFLLNKPYLESSVCRLLCQISKLEDARRWVVQQILTSSGNPKPYTYALLSLLKSYRGNVVPERIYVTSFHYKNTPVDDNLKKAYSRKSLSNVQVSNSQDSNIQWNTLNLHDDKSKKLMRLIPSVDSFEDFEDKQHGKKLRSIYEFKTMASLGARPFKIECPAEVLSLLANVAGYHVLAFSDFTIKTRFLYKLYHTLCRVFIFELEPYSENEKNYFLKSLKELQDYIQQSIPVVTSFLYYYLPIWDGEDCRDQILGLLEWIDIRNADELEKYVFPSLRQIYISSGTHCKCLIIETMGKLMRNLLIMDKKDLNCFSSDFQNFNVVKHIESIHTFVSELISNGLTWNNKKNTRSILNTALDFYEMTQAVEQAGDLPLIMMMPPTLVYKCLFSNSRICIARICTLLVRFQLVSVERLYLLGVFEDFAPEVQKLNIYLLDYYRCLWSKLDLKQDIDSFIFQHDIFCDKLWKLKEIYGGIMDKIFGVEYNSTFWDPKTKGLREVVMCHLAEDYPAVIRLKQVTEERLLRGY